MFREEAKERAESEVQIMNDEKRLEIERINNLVNSGYAGLEKGTGKIVDRRENTDALPFPSNRMLNVPEPKEVKCDAK